MQIENFKTFADLVETKSFSKSAKLNGITQSAVSQQARAMERHFKTLLIDRSQKQFQLTREGQRVYESAKEILHTYDKLLSELQEMKKVISGTIRISTIYSIGLHELPAYIKKFLHDYPSVNVRVEYRRSNLVYEDILHNAVDFGLVAFPVKQRQIEAIPFRDDHLVLICHPGHPLAKGGNLLRRRLPNRFRNATEFCDDCGRALGVNPQADGLAKGGFGALGCRVERLELDQRCIFIFHQPGFSNPHNRTIHRIMACRIARTPRGAQQLLLSESLRRAKRTDCGLVARERSCLVTAQNGH